MSEDKVGMYSDDYRVEDKVPMVSEGSDTSEHPVIEMKPAPDEPDQAEVVYRSNEKPSETAEKEKAKKQLLTEPAPSPLSDQEPEKVAEAQPGAEDAGEAKDEAPEPQGEAVEAKEPEKELLTEPAPHAVPEKGKGKKK